jgi:hypothetical protein
MDHATMDVTVDHVTPQTWNLRTAARILGQIPTTNQCNPVLNHIILKGSISPLEADSLYRVKRLTSRIHDLKRYGVNLIAEMRQDATGKRYCRYFIAG